MSQAGAPLSSAVPQTRKVGILGGMGPAAGADFVRLFVQACTEQLRRRGAAVVDQAFPEHWLAQIPAPDRTSAIAAPERPEISPLDAMSHAVQQLHSLDVRIVAIACNTAHYWHQPLQQRHSQVRILHIINETIAHLQQAGVREVLLMATQGTHRSRLYDSALEAAGIAVHTPLPHEREQVMQGIFEGVKRGRLDVANQYFGPVVQALRQRHAADTLVMACTEIPLALPQASQAQGLKLIDPAWVLAQALAAQAYV
ncbi:aspartate racemase [Lampropedia cohaerens]|uniref:Aspartate racemase n=1 Tax=Lampropedia cohaerens TaxID=1610491 RepID=A0A0U1PWH2_9BURK|nr:amino acid racemase [Lampropedia cohaerens]KKW66893.1 aspartate racemase [Lampropedia cohaerens]